MNDESLMVENNRPIWELLAPYIGNASSMCPRLCRIRITVWFATIKCDLIGSFLWTEMSFRPSDSSPSGGGRCCDMMGRRPSRGHHLWPEHNRHWPTSSSILFLVSSLLILAIANAHQQLPTAAGTSILYIFFPTLMAVTSVMCVRLWGYYTGDGRRWMRNPFKLSRRPVNFAF